MTAIAGIVHDGTVWIGADSASIGGTSVQVRADEKVFAKGPFVIGFAANWRFGQLVRYSLDLPAPFPGDLHEWMCTEFAGRLRDCLGTAAPDRRESRPSGLLLVGVGGRLFEVTRDYAIGERIEPYAAIGCARDLVLGSLHTTEALGCFGPETRLEMALSAAERYSAGVRGPWCIRSAPALCAAGKDEDRG